MARNNGQWRAPAIGEAMVIVRGPDAYISPGWYATKREHGRVVPTWNYITAHAYGRRRRSTTIRLGRGQCPRTDRPARGRPPASLVGRRCAGAYIAGQLKAIVGVEIAIDRVEAKFKLSQNRSDADIAGAIEGLEERGEHRVSAAMRALDRAGRTSR